jgi:hypothetical protein
MKQVVAMRGGCGNAFRVLTPCTQEPPSPAHPFGILWLALSRSFGCVSMLCSIVIGREPDAPIAISPALKKSKNRGICFTCKTSRTSAESECIEHMSCIRRTTKCGMHHDNDGDPFHIIKDSVMDPKGKQSCQKKTKVQENLLIKMVPMTCSSLSRDPGCNAAE